MTFKLYRKLTNERLLGVIPFAVTIVALCRGLVGVSYLGIAGNKVRVFSLFLIKGLFGIQKSSLKPQALNYTIAKKCF